MTSLTLTPQKFAAYKQLVPESNEIQDLTFEDVVAKVGDSANYNEVILTTEPDHLEGCTARPCEERFGYVVYDCICLFIGARQLRTSDGFSDPEKLSEAVNSIYSELSSLFDSLMTTDSAEGQAQIVFNIISTIYNSGLLGSTLTALYTNLSVYEAALYGSTTASSIINQLSDDGAATIGAIAVELATFGFLQSDVMSYDQACPAE